MSLPIDVIDHATAERPAEPAATIVLLRDGPGDELEVLMIHRGVDTAFGGMWAFPGGAIDASDVHLEDGRDPVPAARRAAARETHEEVGLHVDAASLVSWSHWLPPNDSRRRFSTWFFAAHVGDADYEITIADGEILDHRWIVPAVALAMQATGDLLVAPPTFVTLEQLVRYDNVQSALAAASPRAFATQIAWAPDGTRICIWHGDAAYGSDDPSVAGPRHRLVMDDAAGWRYFDHR